MEKTIKVPAFAKVNLTLDVLGKRPDGYHEMRMVMQAVELCDEVDITISGGHGITAVCDKAYLPKDLDNLAGKAAKAFFERTGKENIGVDIRIEKRIPDRAGLAGGSSDAAAVIRGLDKLLETGLSPAELQEICSRVGSDVAFCLQGGTALATGRGELIRELPSMPDCAILLVKPGFSVSTPALFARIDDCSVTKRPDTDAMRRALEGGDLSAVAGNLRNVFEEALPERERETVERIRTAMLERGALGASMTGTGSVVYGIFETEAAARKALSSSFGECFITRPLKKIL